MTAPIFTWSVGYGTAMDITPRALSAKFGDGYEQRVADGINYALEAWNVVVNSVDSGGVSPVEQFLHTQGGVTAFQWTTPTGRVALFVCRSWKRDILSPTVSKVSGKFEEVLG